MSVCAIIPAFNEEKRLVPVVTTISKYVDAVLVIDDGSTDQTAEIARAAGAEVLVHGANQGKGKSLRNGLDWGMNKGFEGIVTLDADGQHLPDEVTGFLAAFAEGADLVVGNRMEDTSTMPTVRRLTNQFMSGLVSRLAKNNIPDSQCGYRLIRASAWREISPTIITTGFDFESDILIQAGRTGKKITNVPISTVYGDEVSKIRPVRDTIRFFSMVIRKLIEKPPPL